LFRKLFFLHVKKKAIIKELFKWTKWVYLSPFSWSFSLFSFLPLASFDDTLLESDVWDKSNSFDTSTLSAKRDFFAEFLRCSILLLSLYVLLLLHRHWKKSVITCKNLAMHFSIAKFLINVNNIWKKINVC
jgi:hypothetical protein